MRPLATAARTCATFLLAFLLTATALAGEPSDRVASVNSTLLDAMQRADELGFVGRYELLSPVLADAFNFPLMARIAAGRHWRKLDDDQRVTLIDAFARMSISTFASRFDGYGGERFEILGERPAARGNVTVLNQIVQPAGKTTSINYVVGEFEDNWLIVDIFLDGKFSELALARSEYSSVINRDGFDALLTILEDRIARLATRAS